MGRRGSSCWRTGSAVEADLLVVGLGVEPRTGLAEAAGLEVDDGVLVDATFETSVRGVFAVGDIARFPDPLTGRSIRVEHWAQAERSGALAAVNLLGGQQAITEPPFYWTQQFGKSFRPQRPRRVAGATARPTVRRPTGSCWSRSARRAGSSPRPGSGATRTCWRSRTSELRQPALLRPVAGWTCARARVLGGVVVAAAEALAGSLRCSSRAQPGHQPSAVMLRRLPSEGGVTVPCSVPSLAQCRRSSSHGRSCSDVAHASPVAAPAAAGERSTSSSRSSVTSSVRDRGCFTR